MTDEQDPPRLLVTGAAELRELLPGLERARTEGPSPEQLARIMAATSARLTADGGGANEPQNAEPASPEPASTGVAGTGASAAKLIKLLAVVIVLGGGAFMGSRLAQPRVPADGSSTPSSAVAPVAPAQPQPALPAATAERSTPAQVEARASERPALRRTAAAGSGAQRRAARSEPASAGDADAELALLKRARADVRANPARALALTAEHAARFARGTFVEEREVIAIEALLEQGERGAAQARARAFFAAYPGSAHARRVRALLTEHGAALSDENTADDSHPSR